MDKKEITKHTLVTFTTQNENIVDVKTAVIKNTIYSYSTVGDIVTIQILNPTFIIKNKELKQFGLLVTDDVMVETAYDAVSLGTITYMMYLEDVTVLQSNKINLMVRGKTDTFRRVCSRPDR